MLPSMEISTAASFAPRAAQSAQAVILAAIQASVQRVNMAGELLREDVVVLRDLLRPDRWRGRLPEHPALVLGAWESLPAPAQAVLRRAAELEIRRGMDFYPRGRLWPSMIGGWLTVQRALEQQRVSPALLSMGSRWASRAWDGPSRLAERTYRLRRLQAWQRGTRVTVEDLLAAIGKRPQWLLGDYVRGVRVDERCRGFHWDRAREQLFGQLIGVDLLPTARGVWCVEANISTAFNEGRRAVLDPEPSVAVLFREAAAAGVRHVVWQDMERSEVRPWLLRELHEAAHAHGMTVDVRESYRIPSRSDLAKGEPRPGKFIHSAMGQAQGTFVLRRSTFAWGSDFLVSNKAPFIRGVHAVLEALADGRAHVPTMSADPADVFAEAEEDLPNLVYKYPDIEKGEGVFFMRARDPEHANELAETVDRATGEPAGLFQPFVCSRLLEGRRVYDVRCELLITPKGARHVFSIRREAMQSLPQGLPDGLVTSSGVFTSNLATGGRFAPVDPSEADEVRDAALAIGDALVAALNNTFETME